MEAFHDLLAEAGVTRAYVVCENGELTLSHPKLLEPIAAFFRLSQDFADHEGVFIGREEGIPTLFFAGVHDTRRGLAQGGLRYKPYENMAEVLVDVLRLAQGMTRKNALAGLWWGGGKGVVPMTQSLDDPTYRTEGTPERLALFRAYGRFIASLGGVYYTAEDIGTKTSDMNALLSQNRFTTCIGGEFGGSGNPSPHTARGVFVAMQAAWRFLTGSDDLRGVGVAVQGTGNVGTPLIELLDDVGAKVFVSDIDRGALEALKAARPTIEVVEDPNGIFDVPADIFAPCAIGAQVNRNTIPRLQMRLVCGAANNILAEPEDAHRLRKRGIAYVPDYLCNRMGITNCADEWQGYLQGDVQLAAERVYPDTLRVLRHARGQMVTSSEAADQLADIAACELHPLIGHRGRRLIDHLVNGPWADGDSGRSEGSGVEPAFDPGRDEPSLRVRWEHSGRFLGDGLAVAAAPISAADRPDLAALFSALLMDVRARALELEGKQLRRVVGSDPGGLALQLAVERALPFEREEMGRPRFVERCADVHRQHDEAIRRQLHELGVGFDPGGWLDPMATSGRAVSRRLFHALDDAGMMSRERHLTYYDPIAQTVLVSPDVIRTTFDVDERFEVAFDVEGDGGPSTLKAWTFFPELLGGAVAVGVRASGPWGKLAGGRVRDPLREGETIPIVAVEDLGADAEFLVPDHDRKDHGIVRRLGLAEERPVIDARGRILVPGEPPLGREEARRLVVDRLGSRIVAHAGQYEVEAYRSRRSETLVNLGTSEQLFVRFDNVKGHLRRAIESRAVTFSHDRWRQRVLELLDTLEPWCISRQSWWGQPVPTSGSDTPGEAQGEVLSVWFSLAAWSLQAAGWPVQAAPEPVAEVFVDTELLSRWIVPSQLVSLAITGRPAYRHIHVHDPLHVVERVLEPREGVASDAPDEERFVARSIRRPMRLTLGNAVEPQTLIRRFGADALRLGYLLSLHSDTVATADESHLRRARSTVRRLNGKITGLFHMTRHMAQQSTQPSDTAPSAPALADLWIQAAAGRAACKARGAYAEHRLNDAAQLLCNAVDDLGRWAALAADAEEHSRNIRPTATAVVARLTEGFKPICPFLFAKLTQWTTARSEPATVDVPFWLAELVETLRPGKGAVRVTSDDAAVLELLRAGQGDLAALTGRGVEVVDGLQGESAVVGPCRVG